MSVKKTGLQHAGYGGYKTQFRLPATLILFAVILTVFGSGLQGPFVFADESAYRGMIYSFSTGSGISGYRQYGPLYPFLVALAGHIFPVHNVYFLARSINIFFAIVALIPFWKFAEELLGKTWLFWAAIAGFILSPFWTYTVVTWAEPLFYSLFFWSVYLVHSGARNLSGGRAVNRFFAAGVVCGLMFLAKPADIVYGFALIAGYFLVCNRKILHVARYKSGFIALASGWGLMVIPFILRNIFLEQTTALGYPYVGELLRKLVETVSVYEVIRIYLASLAYHLSYIFAAGFGSLFLVYYLLAKFWVKITDSDKLLLIYLGISLAGICLLSSIHMIIFPPYGYRTPNGRYLTQFVPVFVCILFYMYRRYFMAENYRLTLRQLSVFISVLLVVLVASPLYVLGAFMIVNGPDLAVYFLMIEGKHIPWRSQFSPDVYQLMLPVAVTMLGLLPFIFRPIRSIVGAGVTAIWLVFLTAGVMHQSWLIHTMAGTQKQLNKLFFRSSLGQMNINLCDSNVYYDSMLADTNIPFLYQYWCPSNKINYLNSADIKRAMTLKEYSEKRGYIFTKSNDTGTGIGIPQAEGYSLFPIRI